MMRKAEIIIIGGGVVGASVAFHLCERGADGVLILEREARQGLGSTGAATGGIRAQFETDINIQTSLYSLDFFRNWEFDCDYEPAGYLFFATNGDQLDSLKRNVENQRMLGVKDVEIVDAQAISELVPGMNCDDVTGGSFGKHDGFINPLAVMRGFTESALRHGAKIEFETQVLSITTNGGKVTGVLTNNGQIECEIVVLCTGARAAELALTASIDLPVEPQRRQIVWAYAAEPLPTNLPMVIDIGSGFHFRPARDFSLMADAEKRTFGNTRVSGRDLLFAYPDRDEPSSLNTEIDDAFIEKVYECAKNRAAFLFESEIIRKKCRAGLYENTPDHHAILGGCGVEGLYFANGFSGHGVMHSPATGRALAEIILDGQSGFLDVSPLHIDRFANGRHLRESAFI